MPSTRKEREETVSTLTQDFEGIQALVVAGYTGVKTPELNELRSKLRPLKSQCRIVKNSLAQIALKNKGIDGFGEFFTGQSALVIQKNGDAIAGLKILVDFEKSHENLKIRAGYLNGRVLKSAEIKAMAALPSKPVLLAQMAAGMQSPLVKFHGVLSASMRYLASALDQVAKKRETQKS
jgi:large subunit ribosomal protein L10